MGLFGSKKVTVGYKYHMGIHFSLSRTALDVLRAIKIGGRFAWKGYQDESSRFHLNAYNLFGGEKEEGGVQGYCDLMMGEETQLPNEYLSEVIDGPMPAFRGFCSLVFNGPSGQGFSDELGGIICMVNPYPKPWVFKFTRIKQGWGLEGGCWYPEKAEIFCFEGDETSPFTIYSPSLMDPWISDDTDPRNGSNLHRYRFFSPGEQFWRDDIETITSEINTFWTDNFTGIYTPTVIDDAGSPLSPFFSYSKSSGVASSYPEDDASSYSHDNAKTLHVSVANHYPDSTYGFLIGQTEVLPVNCELGVITQPDPDKWIWWNGTGINMQEMKGLWQFPVDDDALAPCFVDEFGKRISQDGLDVSFEMERVPRPPGSAEDGWGVVGGTFKWLQHPYDSTTGSTTGTNEHWYPIGPAIPESDPNYNNQAFWEALAADAIASGRMPAHKTYQPVDYQDLTEIVDHYPHIVDYAYAKLENPDPELTRGQDMNPAHIIMQLLTDPDLEMGYPIADVDEAAFTYAADTFFSECLGLTLSWNRQSSIQDFIQIILDHCNAVLYADPFTGKFVLKPIRGDYDPDSLTVYDEDSIIAIESFQRPGIGETVNQITVRYYDQLLDMEAATPPLQNLANIQAQGKVVSQIRDYPGFSHGEIAGRIAMRDLKVASAQLARATVKMNRKYWNGTPGSVLKINWPKLGLEEVIFRVIGIKYGSLESNEIVIELVEDVFGLPDSTYAVEQPSGWEEPDLSPQEIVIQDLTEGTYWDIRRTSSAGDLDLLSDDSAFTYTMAALETNLGYGYNIYTRVSPAEFEEITTAVFVPTARLSADVLQQDGVIYFEDGINISNVTAGQRALIGSPDNRRFAEWVEVVDVYDDGATMFVNRGILDTVPQNHSATDSGGFAAARIWFVTEDDIGLDSTERTTGEEVNVRLTSFTGIGEFPLEDATDMFITMDQRFTRPYPPGKIRVNGEAWPTLVEETIEVEWAHRDRLLQITTYINQEESSIGPEAGTTYNVYIYDNDTDDLLEETTGLSGTTHISSVSGSYNIRLEIEAQRSGIVSWQRQIREFAFVGDMGRVTEDEQLRSTEDEISLRIIEEE